MRFEKSNFIIGTFIGTLILLVGLLYYFFYLEFYLNKDIITPVLPSSTPILTETILPKTIVKASIPYWDHKRASESFRTNIKNIDYVNVFWFFVTSNGLVQKYKYATIDTDLILFAQKNKVKVFAVITNLPESSGTTWDSKRIENILNNKEKMEKHVRDISDLLNAYDFDGVTIDYEELVPSSKNDFSDFVDSLSMALHKNGKMVNVSLHPRNFDKKYDRDDGSGSQDWERLSKTADQLTIMGYGEHWDTGEAGPIASISWIENIISYARDINIPFEKLFLGIGLYGYDWNKDNDEAADGLEHVEVVDLLEKYRIQSEWDSENESPHFRYRENNEDHEVWYEDAQSVGEKMKTAKFYGFAGVSFWRLGGEDEKVWDVVLSFR